MMAFGADAGLPPAFDTMGEIYQGLDCMTGMVDQDMQDMCIPAMAYDPNSGWCSGWCVPVPGNCGAVQQGQDSAWESFQECMDPMQQQELTQEQLQEQLQQQQELLQEQPEMTLQVSQELSGHEPEGGPHSEGSASGRQQHEEGPRASHPSKGSGKAETAYRPRQAWARIGA